MDWFLTRFQRKVGGAVKEFGLIKPGDRILLALSGGKDSLVMLHSLKIRSINFPFQVYFEAAYINNRQVPYEIDTEYLESFCSDLEIPFIVINTDLDVESDSKKQACFICSWNRRKELFTYAQEKGCNKVALGHHKDDIIQTLIMNMAFQGSISTMPPRLSIFDGKLEIIRPLAGVTEDECAKYAEIVGFQKEKKLCPHEDLTKRKKIEEIIKKLQELNPDVKSNIFNSMTNIQSEYLPGYTEE